MLEQLLVQPLVNLLRDFVFHHVQRMLDLCLDLSEELRPHRVVDVLGQRLCLLVECVLHLILHHLQQLFLRLCKELHD